MIVERWGLVLGVLAAGCSSAPGVCDAFEGRPCIAVRVTGADAEMLIQQVRIASDELSLYADTPPAPAPPGKLPDLALPREVAVVPREGFLGPFTLRGHGLRGGEIIGEGAISGAITRRDEHLSVDLHLVAPKAPPDFACTNQLGQLEAWTRAEPYIPECGARTVFVLDELGPINAPTALSMAWARTGELAIAVHATTSFEGGDLIVTRFAQPTTSGEALVHAMERVVGGDFAKIGAANALAVDAEGKFHLAYSESDGSSSTIWYRTLPAAPGDEPEHVVGVGPTALALAVTESSPPVSYLAYQDATTGGFRWHERRAVEGAVTWSEARLIESRTALPQGGKPVALALDELGAPHVAYHFRPPAGFGQPIYRALLGGDARMTLDNIAGSSPDRGGGVRLALQGTRRAVTYLRAPTVGLADGEIRVASWDATVGAVTIRTDAQAIRQSPDGYLPRLATSFDQWGTLHQVYSVETDGQWVLSYRRASADGELVEDTIAESSRENGDSLVEMLVDPTGRPHIVYYDAVTGYLHYATRFDR